MASAVDRPSSSTITIRAKFSSKLTKSCSLLLGYISCRICTYQYIRQSPTNRWKHLETTALLQLTFSSVVTGCILHYIRLDQLFSYIRTNFSLTLFLKRFLVHNKTNKHRSDSLQTIFNTYEVISNSNYVS